MNPRTGLGWLLAVSVLAPGHVAATATPLAIRGTAPRHVQQSPSAEETALEARVREVASQLRCPVCRSLSIYDSPSEMAQQMRALIRERLRAGSTPEEITAYFVDRYGEWVLLEPPARGFNWTVWLLPILVLAGGLTFVILTARRWVAKGQAREAALLEGGEGER